MSGPDEMLSAPLEKPSERMLLDAYVAHLRAAYPAYCFQPPDEEYSAFYRIFSRDPTMWDRADKHLASISIGDGNIALQLLVEWRYFDLADPECFEKVMAAVVGVDRGWVW